MAQVTLYGLKNCDTCRRALADLERAGHDVVVTDIHTAPDLADKVPQWLAAVGSEKLVNRRSTTWRNLSEAQRRDADGKRAADLLVANPTLVKRPVIEAAGAVHAGWSKDARTAFGAG